jgi:NADPH2:quinone reductase
MRAAWFDRFGPAREVLQVGEQPTPSPAAGEVLVRLATSGINPSDVKKRAGSAPTLLDGGAVIPNSDGAGVIEAVGAGVDAARIGERVWVYQAQYARRFGTAAEYVAIASRRAPLLPAEAGFDAGACLGIPVMTAHRCVFADGAVEGHTILVTGGAGRVGHYAIQWAAQSGARVIATASNPADAASCREAGAVAVVNHREADWGARVREANGGLGVDRAIEVEFGANIGQLLAAVRPSGTIATYGSAQCMQPQLPFYQLMYQDLTVRFVIVYAMPEDAKQAAIRDIDAALRAGRLRHRFAARLPLAGIAHGNELIEDPTCRGAVVLTLD